MNKELRENYIKGIYEPFKPKNRFMRPKIGIIKKRLVSAKVKITMLN